MKDTTTYEAIMDSLKNMTAEEKEAERMAWEKELAEGSDGEVYRFEDLGICCAGYCGEEEARRGAEEAARECLMEGTDLKEKAGRREKAGLEEIMDEMAALRRTVAETDAEEIGLGAAEGRTYRFPGLRATVSGCASEREAREAVLAMLEEGE